MIIDITLYKDRALVRFVYNTGDASQWVEYPDGTKSKAIEMIEEWYSTYKDYLATNDITINVHDNDYFSLWRPI